MEVEEGILEFKQTARIDGSGTDGGWVAARRGWNRGRVESSCGKERWGCGWMEDGW